MPCNIVLLNIMESVRDFVSLPLTNPILILSVMLLIILLAPLILGKFNIPGIIGLILAGVLIGPYGLGLLENNSPIELFSTIGLLYIMFLAGLDLDMNQFKVVKNKSLVFGILTFTLPLLIGFPVCRYILGLDFWASLLTASMFSTHTLVAYPIVSKFGISKNEAVAITVGGTILTDTLVLVLLAVILDSKEGNVDVMFFVKMLAALIVFSLIMFLVVPRITKWFFKKLDSEKHAHFIFVLAVMLFAAFLAEVCGLEAIIGAFVAGLVLNRLIPHSSPLMNRIEFIGNAFFIPFFLISVGIMLDLGVLLTDYHPILIAIVLSVAACLGKWIAAWLTRLIYKLSRHQQHLIFGLSSSHAAATLAIILAGYNAGILDENILNGTIILILITCMLASFITEKSAKRIVLDENNDTVIPTSTVTSEKILIPVANIANLEPLLDISILMKEKKSKSPVMILSVVPDNEQAEINVMKAKTMLQQFVKHGSSAEVDVNITATIDHSVSGGIVRMSRVMSATTLMLGWPGKTAGVIDKFFGSHIMKIVNNTDKAVYVCSFDRPLIDVRRIFLMTTPLAEVEKGFESWVYKIALLSGELKVPVVHYGDEHTALLINNFLKNKRLPVTLTSVYYSDWDNFSNIASYISKDDLITIVSSRQGFPSYLKRFDLITDKLTESYRKNAKIAIYPQQNHENMINEG